MSLYLWLNIFTFGTLFLSFDKKVAFYKYFSSLAVAIVLTAFVFIPWDSYFASIGVWGFNPEYLMGISFFHLPVEEWLFFITVPFACTFIHYVLIAYFKNPFDNKSIHLIWNSIAILILIIGLINYKQFYTCTASVGASISVLLINRFAPAFMRQFTFTYFICLLPFLLVNGILTGSFTPKPIVWYNEIHIFGLRIFTIPVEDTVYNLMLLLMSVYLTHVFYNRKKSV